MELHFKKLIFVNFIYHILVSEIVICQESLSSSTCDETPSIQSLFGERQGRIVGGMDADRGSLPFIVSLTRRGGHFCGATIISNRWLVTAAHCVCNGFNTIIGPNQIKAVFGLHKISEFKKRDTIESDNNEITDDGDGYYSAYEMGFKNIVVHPEYKCRKPESDIALLELNEPITFNDRVKPTCIASSGINGNNNTYEGQTAIISGWGFTHENQEIGDRADTLQHARVEVWNNDECQQSFRSQKKPHVITARQLCAGKQAGGVDSCWADSGGPLISKDNFLIGIVSTGVGCGRPGLPGIYTRVSAYTQWITDAMVQKSF